MAASAAAAQERTTEQIAAAELARLAQIDLLRTPEPAEADFAIAADLLAIAHALDSSDEQILRLGIEAAGQCRTG